MSYPKYEDAVLTGYRGHQFLSALNELLHISLIHDKLLKIAIRNAVFDISLPSR